MASFDVIVKLVDQTKSSMRNIESGLKNIEKQGEKTSKALGAVSTAVTAIVSSVAAGKIVDLARNFGDLEARIRATSGSGAQTAEVMAYLATTAGRLGISLDDAAKAFSILRANGIDASYNSLEAWTKLATVSGRSVEDIADAVANAYQGSFGKISKATEDLITVEERFGQYVVKAGGQVIATARSTGEAVGVIQRYTQANEAFADAFQSRTNSITAALNRLQTTVAGNTGWSTLGQSIAGLIDKFNQLLAGSGTVGKAINYLAQAVNFLGDNFETIITIIEIVGSIFLVGKLFQGIQLIGRGIIALGQNVKSLGFIFTNLGTAVTNPITYIVASWRSLSTSIAKFAERGAGAVEIAFLRVFGSVGTLIKNLGYTVRGLAAPFTALAAYFTGLFDPIIERFRSIYDWVGRLAQRLNPFSSGTPAAPPVPPASPVTPPAPAAPPAAAGTTNPGVNPMTEYLTSFAQNLAKTRREYQALLDLLARTTDIDLAAKLFQELSAKAEELGIVLQRPINLIERDLRMALARSTEEVRVANEQYRLNSYWLAEYANQLELANVELMRQVVIQGQTALMERKFQNELLASSLALNERAIKLYDAEYQEMSFIQTLRASMITRLEAEKLLEQYNDALARGRINLQEYAQAVRNIDETLLGATERQRLLVAEVQRGSEVQTQNTIIAAGLQKQFEAGEITARQLAMAIKSLGEEFFTYKSIVEGAVITAADAVYSDETRKKALEELTKRFREGAVAARVYRSAAGSLGGDTEEIERTVNAYANFRDRVVETNEAIKASVRGAATTFSKEFTEAFVNAQNPLKAFKNFFTNLLTDMANRIVKQQLADPLADALSRMANEVIGTNGEGRAAQIMSGGMQVTGNNMAETIQNAGSRMQEYMTSAAQGIGNIFSGMGDGLMSIFSNVFNWIKDGLGSIGSGLGSIFSSAGGGGGSSFFGDIFGSIGSFLGFADGGRPPVGQVSLVGERSPELFVPDSGGTIVPMDELGGSDQLVVNFNLNAIDTMTGTQFLLQNKPAIVNMIGEAYNKRGRRGPLD